MAFAASSLLKLKVTIFKQVSSNTPPIDPWLDKQVATPKYHTMDKLLSGRSDAQKKRATFWQQHRATGIKSVTFLGKTTNTIYIKMGQLIESILTIQTTTH